MAGRNVTKLQELIYDILTGDPTLVSLVGSADSIKYGNPKNVSEYPCITYQILTEVDNPYFTDNNNAHITTTQVVINCFVDNTSPKTATAIDTRIYSLLDGQRLSNSDIQVYTCYRQTRNEMYEDSVDVWRITSIYNLVNVNIT